MSRNELRPIVVFDLDGTLVDTAPDLLDAINAALEWAGEPAVDTVRYRAYVGHGGQAMLQRAFSDRNKALPAPLLAELLERFISVYESTMPGRSRLFDGAGDLIRDLKADGFGVAVCTNKIQRLSDRLLETMEISPWFDAICGADRFAARKPDPLHLLETIREAGGDPDRALMVGDSKTDIDTAKNAGIPVAALTLGYTDLPLAPMEPTGLFANYSELTLDWIKSVTRAV